MSRVNGFRKWDQELEAKYWSSEEIAESDIEVALITEIIQARKEQGLSQRDLEQITGIKQPQIARMEVGSANPRLKTIVKILAAMGKKLAVVPMNYNGK